MRRLNVQPDWRSTRCFSASKLAWVMQNVPQAATLLATGRLRAGTVDS